MMPLNNNRVSDLVSQIYDAALDTTSWPAILARLADYSGADIVHLILMDESTGHIPWATVARTDPTAHEEYIKEYASVDKRLLRLLNNPNGQPWTTHSLMSPEEISACPVHNEFLKKHDVFHLMGVKVNGIADGTLIHAALRHEKKRRFQRPEIDRWTLFLPHVRRSVQMMCQLQQQKSVRSSLTDALDFFAIGVLLIDARGRILMANRYADELMRENDGFISLESHPTAARSDENKQLHGLLAATGDPKAKCSIESGGSLRLSRPSGSRPYAVTICPLPERQVWRVEGATTILFISDPDRSNQLPAERLASLFHFTPAEGRLAAALAAGVTLCDYSEQAEITISTARTMLKRVMHKANCSKQADLVRRILMEVGTLNF